MFNLFKPRWRVSMWWRTADGELDGDESWFDFRRAKHAREMQRSLIMRYAPGLPESVVLMVTITKINR